MDNKVRDNSFGENHRLTFVDKFGVWLSNHRISRIIERENVQSLGDFGCGFNARFSTSIRTRIQNCVLLDVALSDELLSSNDFETHVGPLPEVLNEVRPESLDFVVLNSVLEHLDEPGETLEKIHHVLKPGGILFVNVPTWLGKRLLEFLAFKLRLSPSEEMEDHRRYYNRRELWLELRSSGFIPSKIKVRFHKLGMNVFAIARKI
jgi:SAM-dependent methyltransferase